MSEAPLKRKRPNAATRKRILNEQDYHCLYCRKRFGSTLWKGEREITLRVEWYHAIPFSYSRSNRANIVAACQVCNRIKHDAFFTDIEDVRIYVNERREAKGYSNVRPMRERIYPETPTSKIL
jgi:5-methylcytosine-specific restriction endonuclease McrA